MLRKVLLLGGVSLCAAVTVHDVPHVQHNGDIHGFSVSHVWAVSGGEVVSFKLGAAKRSAKAQEYEEFNADHSSASKTRTLAKLSLVVAYDNEPGAYGADTMSTVTANGDLYFNNASYSEDVTEMRRISTLVFEARKWDTAPTDTVAAVTASPYIVAFTFISRLGVSVLVFRGTTAAIDQYDVMAASLPFISSGLGQKRWIDAWRNDAGLAWTSRQEFNSQRNTAEDRSAMKNEGKLLVGTLLGATTGSADLTAAGFTPIAVSIATMWHAQAKAAGLQTTMTGHSLGGARAAAASMKLREAGEVVTATTFGSIGSACWTRSNYFGFSLLNSSKEDQPQLTEYVHPLDTWGNALGRDVGRRCFWGKRNIAESRAKQYCEPISALDMAYLQRIMSSANIAAMAAASPAAMQNYLALKTLAPTVLRNLNETELTHVKQMWQCLYFTHHGLVTHEELLKELNVDGSTQSGCETLKPVEWGNEQCPWNFPVPVEGDDDFWTGKPGGPVFIVFMIVTVAALVWGVTRCAGEELDDDASEEFNDWQAERDQEVRAEIEAEAKAQEEENQ